MKKIYSLILLAVAALGANAQVVLTYNGEIVDPTKTLEVHAEEISEYYEEWDFWDQRVECGTQDPRLLNQGSSAASVEVTAAFENLNVGIQWCFPSECTFLQKPTESRSGTLTAKESKSLFLEPAFTFGEYTTTKCKLTVKEDKKSTTYNILYVYSQESGIQSVTNTTATTSIITDLQGRRVAQPQAGSLYIQNGRKFIQK